MSETAEQRRQRIEHLAHIMGIHIATPTPLTKDTATMHHRRQTLAASPAPDPKTTLDKITAVIEALGLDPDATPEDMTGALDALLADAAGSPDEALALRSLSASERKAVARTPGATATTFLSAKRALGRGR